MKQILFGIFAATFLIFPTMAQEIEVSESAQEIAAAVNPRNATSVAAPSRRTSAAARVSLINPVIRTAAPVLPAPVVSAQVPTEELDCGIGEYQSGNKCTACDEKNNPGVRWANPGKSCEISECIDGDYVLVDANKEQPKCVQKCDVWGGVASREWSKTDADFSFCGSGKFLECESGFTATREQTASSGTPAGHCAIDGIMTGACKTDGRLAPGKFANGQCMQVCENGYWSGCTISRFCESGYHEDNYREVIVVKDKKDSSASVFDCVANNN
jgi:hypothetical protein